MKSVCIIIALVSSITPKIAFGGILNLNVSTPTIISKTFDCFSGVVAYTSAANNGCHRIITVNIKLASFELQTSHGFHYCISLPKEFIIADNAEISIIADHFITKMSRLRADTSGFGSLEGIDVAAKIHTKCISSSGNYIAAAPVNVVVNYD